MGVATLTVGEEGLCDRAEGDQGGHSETTRVTKAWMFICGAV